MVQYILTKNGYIIPKKGLSKKELDKIKSDLNITPKNNQDYGEIVESFNIYKEDRNNLIIPRYYGIKTFGIPKEDIDIRNSKVDFEFTGKLRNNQVDIAKVALRKIKEK